ncbi:MAG: tetratricopeptide repeat protein [Moorellaceae bacterium]
MPVGFMNSLRRLGRRRPLLGVVLTVVLAVGLLAGYIAWSPAGGVSSGTGQENTDITKQMEEWQRAAGEQISQREAEIAELEKQVQEKPQDAGLWLKLGDNRYEVGSLYLLVNNDMSKAEASFKGALECYRKVQELNPQEKGLNLKIAKTAVFLGDNALAETNYSQAVASDPKDNNARMSYAMFLALVKSDYKGAIAQWQEILNNNPDPEMADYVREMIKQAEESQKAAEAGSEKPDSGSGQ